MHLKNNRYNSGIFTVGLRAILSITVFSVILTSCKEDKPITDIVEIDEIDYTQFQGLDLSKNDIPATIMLPDETANIGASTTPEVHHMEGDFYWDIEVGPNYLLHIEDFGDNTDLVESHKRQLKQRDMFKVKYLVDEKDLIVYERTLLVKGIDKASPKVGVEHKSYHVYGQRKVDGVNYELRSRDDGYEKVIIDLMTKSIRSFQEK